MKHIKTFEQFVNESKLNEISGRFKPKKPSKASMPFFFQIFAREADKDGNRETHRVSVGKNDDYNEVKRQVLKDYPANKYYYTIWQNVRGGFKNIGTNESEDLTEEFFNEAMNNYYKNNHYSKPWEGNYVDTLNEFGMGEGLDIIKEAWENWKSETKMHFPDEYDKHLKDAPKEILKYLEAELKKIIK